MSLQGKRIVNTRALHQAADLDDLLIQRGAIPLPYPCIAIAPPDNTDAFDYAIHAATAGAFDWLVLTSANTVFALAARLQSLGLRPDILSRVSLAVVGAATARSAEETLGLRAALMPEHFVAEALTEVMKSQAGGRVFLPQSAIAETTLVDDLSAAGMHITAVEAYQTVIGSGGVDLPALLREQNVDAVTLTSGSTARNLIARLEAEGENLDLLAGVCIACIGSKTAKSARDCGLQVAVVPREHTLEAMIDALEAYFSSRTSL